MSIVKKSTMVRPAEETPRRSLWLSNLDLVISSPYYHVLAIFIYSQPKNGGTFFDAEVLKEALSKTLVLFYPMAGRLTSNPETGRLEIDCNGEGALFIEAEATDYDLAYFEDQYFTPNEELRNVMLPKCDYSGGVSSFPISLIQLTRFRCGGVALGTALNHQTGDGAGHLHFINSWARLARGLDLEVLPIHERFPHLLPRNPPQVNFHHFEYDPPQTLPGELQKLLDTSPKVVSIFKLSKEQVATLKWNAESPKMNYKPTTFEALAGHVWRSACKARGLADDQEVRVLIPVDGRPRLKEPALPRAYNGNVIFISSCIAKAGDVTCSPLWYAANKIRESVKMMNDEEYLRSLLDYLEIQPDLSALIKTAQHIGCPNLLINHFGKLPFYEEDFGWGSPIFGGRGGIGFEGQTIIMTNPKEEGSFLVAINLCQVHMPLFEKYMYDEV